MRNFTRIPRAVLVLGMMIAAPALAFAYTGQNMAKDATVTISQARATALKTVPGHITDQELEKESGGSGLRYSFDIKARKDGATHEVGIDARSGTVLENSIEGPNAD